MFAKSALLAAVLVAPFALAVPSPTKTAKRATCTVDSVAAAADLSDCSDVVISSFTVENNGASVIPPYDALNILLISTHSSETVTMNFAQGATVTMSGEVTFASTVASGPLITFEGSDVSFNGGGFSFNGNGAYYWDGQGTNGGKPKPHPFMKLKASGTFENFVVLNSPAQAISVGNDEPLTITQVYVNNLAGNVDNLGHNTDGFDVSASDVTITNCIVQNQDDCIAINAGNNIVFSNNICSFGHGMSIGSISSGKTVSGVIFSDNFVSESMYGTRIKVDSDATSGSVSNVTWSGNTITGITSYGVLITQSYPDNDSAPGNDTIISDVNFVGLPTEVSVNSDAYRITVDCGNCTGTWDWSGLIATGGETSNVDPDQATIQGGYY
ncbi:uncharacterized protein FIBRA_01512 [Fibroporia radiculosa]|uniref:endo-polygalacturonase n=1 Tax=Fibroporia radiculosa TaxID=599839 RepID=J4H174_9APHY|nr:uncharacterized protein FIBRA_01512 [Fibroporia radiculosa]CCL99494.1 predicted protein [Fibroporia radiculosa]